MDQKLRMVLNYLLLLLWRISLLLVDLSLRVLTNEDIFLFFIVFTLHAQKE